MAAQNPPEVPPPPQAELPLPQAQESGTTGRVDFKAPSIMLKKRTDEPSAQFPNKNAVPESNPQNVDSRIDQVEQGDGWESVADDGDKETQRGVKDRENSVQKLKDRVNDLERRLRQAGLLKTFEDQSDSEATPKAKKGLKRSKMPSSRHGMRDKRKPGLVRESLKETNGEERSVSILVDRIDSLERRLEEAGHLKEKPIPDKPRLPAIPQLQYVEWSGFKNKMAGEEQTHAIEVLVGGAKYYHQRSEEERKNKQRLKDHSNDRDQPIAEDSKSISMPERIRINSKPVLLIMKEIDPTNRSEYPMVMLRPFKPLIYNEARIREVFQELKKKWGDAGIEAPTKLAVKSPLTKNAGDSLTPAVTDGSTGSVSAESRDQRENETTSDTVTTFGETATGQDEISSPPTAGLSPSLLLSANEPIKKAAMIKTENGSSNVVTEVVSKRERNEETEDLTDSVEALNDLRCLIKFMDSEVRPVVESFHGSTRQKVVFSDMWHLFKPGELLYSPMGNQSTSDLVYLGVKPYAQKPNDRFQEAWRVACTAGGRPHLEPSVENYTSTGHKTPVNAFLISAYWVDFSGTRFGSRNFLFFIIPFTGERDITSLQCYPLRFSPKADELKSKWKARGEAFREYMTFKYRYYTGKSLTCAPDGIHRPEDDYPKHAENIDSQVVVDFGEAFAAHPGWKTYTSGHTLAREDYAGEFTEEYPTSYWKDSDCKVLDYESDDDIYEDVHIDTKLMEEYVEHDSLLRDHPQTNPTGKVEIGENHLVLLPNRVFAFVMKARKWSILTIDGLRPIKCYVGGFNDLQLPVGHKRTINSLVNNHFINRNADLDDIEASYDADLVRGKGKGLIILLHGAPGVGKTSTAQTVADAFGKMLFPITCGDLWLTAADVERELSEKFHLAELWDCVLLLDEADVFLARRMNSDIKRNSLVSVFLRVLEHFTGVLFLTTNRVGAFDEAFKSRIHISLYYPPLDAEQTRSIWKMNLERLSKKKQRRNEAILFNEREIFAYANSHYTETFPRGANWNGRQIRNAFQTASALAEFEAHERNRKAKARSAETGEVFVPTDPQLKVRHFKEIAWASYEFDKYISETKGFTDAEIAYREGQRMDEYRVNRRVVRDREQQPIQTREAPAVLSFPVQGPGPRAKLRATPAGQTSAGGNRQVYVRTPVTFTHDALEGQDPKYDQPPPRRTSMRVNNYEAPTAAPIPRSERPSAARSRPKAVHQPGSFVAHDRERQRHEAFDQDEPQYEDEDENTPYEGSQPTGAYVQFEDTNQRELSPRRRQVGDLPPISRRPAVFDYGEDPEDDEDTFDS